MDTQFSKTLLRGIVLTAVLLTTQLIRADQNGYNEKPPSVSEAVKSQADKNFLQNLTTEATVTRLLADSSNDPNSASALRTIADQYYNCERIGRAIELYKHVLNKYPSDPQAMWAQCGLASCYILQNDDVQAYAVVEKLLATGSNDPNIAAAVGTLAARCSRQRKIDNVIELYQRIVGKYPLDSQALWAQCGLASCYLVCDRYGEAKTAVEKFKKDFSNHPRIVIAFNSIANTYRSKNKIDDASELYQYVLSKYPSDKQTMLAQSGLATCYLVSDRYGEARTTVEKLKKNFSDHQQIVGAFNSIATTYRSQNKANDAIELYQYVLSKYPSDNQIMLAQSGLATCYLVSDRYAEARTTVEKLKKGFFDQPQIVSALNGIASTYRGRNKTDDAIELYQYVLSKYPSDNQAVLAQSGLTACYLVSDRYGEAKVAVEKLKKDCSDHPQIADTLNGIANTYRGQNKANNAIELYQYVLSKYSLDSQAMLAQSGLATCYLLSDRYAEAKTVVEKLKKDFPEHPQIVTTLNGIANTYRSKNKADEAIELYQYLLSKYSSDSQAMLAQSGLTACYLVSDRYAEAKVAVEKLKKDFSDHPQIVTTLNGIANTYRGQNKADDAIELYQYVLSKYSSDSQAMLAQSGLTTCYLLSDRYAEAKTVVEKLKKDFPEHPQIVNTLNGIANTYRGQNKTDDAIELYQYVLSKYPSDSQAVLTQSGLAICYLVSDRYAEAKVAVEKLKKDFSDHPQIVNTLNGIANTYRGQNKADDAIELYQYVLSKYSLDSQAMLAQYGLTLCHIQQKLDAKAAIEKLKKDFPEHPQIVTTLNGIANTYRGQNKADDAIELYQYVLSKYPSDSQAMLARYGLTLCYIQQKDDIKIKSSAEELKKNFSDHPQIVTMLNGIANTYRSTNKIEDAIELYQYVLSKYPSDSQALWAQYGLALCYIQQKNDVKIRSAAEKLLVDFRSRSQINKAFEDLIKALRKANKLNIISQEIIVNNWIGNETPLQIQKAGLLYCIEQFNDQMTYKGLEKFIAGLSKYSDAVSIINEIAARCHDLEKHELAVKLYQDYLSRYALEPDKAKLELKLYESMFMAETDLDKTFSCLEQYITKNKGNHTNLTAQAIVLKGQTLIKLGKIDEASKEFLTLMIEYPEYKESPEASFFMGYCYMLQSKFEQAKEAFNLVVKDYSRSSYASKAKLCLIRIETMAK